MDLYVEPFLTPLHLTISQYRHPQGDIPLNSVKILDACYNTKFCRLVALPNYAEVLANRGVYAAVEHSNNLRKDFRGERIKIDPSSNWFRSWEGWKRLRAIQWRHRQGQWQELAFFGELLMTFAAMHNFTFDTLVKNLKFSDEVKTGLITMKVVTDGTTCGSETHLTCPLGLNEFDYASTLTCSELVEQDAFTLGALAMPITPGAVCMLFALAISVGLILLARKKNQNLDFRGAVLLSMTALISQVSSENNGLRSIYAPWMLLVTLISIIYTNTLQSIVVVPENHFEDISFEQRVERNVSFFSSNAAYLQKRFQYYTRSAEAGVTVEDGHNKYAHEYFQKFKHVADRIELLSAMTVPNLLGMNQKQGKVLMEQKLAILMYSRMLQVVGRNAVRGKEKFFELPGFWVFKAQRSFMLVKSLERLKVSGVVQYLNQEAEKTLMKYCEKVAREYVDKLEVRKNAGEQDLGGFHVGLSDSLLKEAFVVLLYGIVLCTAAIALEMLVSSVHVVIYFG